MAIYMNLAWRQHSAAADTALLSTCVRMNVPRDALLDWRLSNPREKHARRIILSCQYHSRCKFISVSLHPRLMYSSIHSIGVCLGSDCVQSPNANRYIALVVADSRFEGRVSVKFARYMTNDCRPELHYGNSKCVARKSIAGHWSLFGS